MTGLQICRECNGTMEERKVDRGNVGEADEGG